MFGCGDEDEQGMYALRRASDNYSRYHSPGLNIDSYRSGTILFPFQVGRGAAAEVSALQHTE